MIRDYHFYPVQHAYNIAAPDFKQRYLCWSEEWPRSKFMWLGCDHNKDCVWFDEDENQESDEMPVPVAEFPTHCMEVRDPQPDTDLLIKKNFLKLGMTEVNMNTFSFGDQQFFRSGPSDLAVITNVTIRFHPEFKTPYIEVYGNTRFRGSKTMYSGRVKDMSDVRKILYELELTNQQ